MIHYNLLKQLMKVTDEEQNILSSGHIEREIYMTENNDTVNSQFFLKKNKLITVRPHVRFIDFPEHTHDFIEVVYMCSGSTVHTVNGKTLELCEGELLFLGRQTKHSIRRAEKNDVAVNFIILPSFFKHSLSVFGGEETPLKHFIAESLNNGGKTDYLYFKVADELPVQNLVENLIWILLNDTRNRHSVNRVTMELLFQHLVSCTDCLAYEDPRDKVIVNVLKYIEDNYCDGSLNEIAMLLNYDPSWLSREIKIKTGSNYTELVQNRRLSQAVYYLKNTNMKIHDIAESVGYDNISFFYRIFSKQYGKTPKEFRVCR